ncbi:ELP3 like acetyltransferase involved in transcription [Cryptosporidium ryanae]|uniref:ELP3 like acetyltransferase involved in transcription n=1 Tax=Cryptosporidium ryanae TaxID=515981 RepID=UPI00351A21B5|nr:ELP3 like acetyltransferase involved in transcription [Cryptosporidium ryanae]
MERTRKNNDTLNEKNDEVTLTFEQVNNSIPAFRDDFPIYAGQIKQLTKEDLMNVHRRRHLESFCKSSSEWLNYDKRQKNEEHFESETLFSFVHELILLSPKTKKEYENVINILRRRHKIAPSKAQIIRVYEELISLKGLDLPNESMRIIYQDFIEANEKVNNIEKSLLYKKAVRSQSGVVVITILTSPGAFSCKHDCHYCPNEPGQPRSYLSTEPAVLRANQNSFDPISQFRDRSITLKNNGHIIDKIELLILGGTWSGYPKEYKNNFIRDVYYAANTFTNRNPVSDNNDYIDRDKRSLYEEIELNQTAECRIIGLTLETRPDYITIDEIVHLRQLGCTRVQLGIQHTDNLVLKLINRGCYMHQIVRSIRLLKDTGYKVDIHLMPDLPNPYDHLNGTELDLSETEVKILNKKTVLLKELQKQIGFDNAQTLGVVNDYLMLSDILCDPKLQCDQWKLYPCEVVPFSKIEEWYEKKVYIPYAELFPDTLCYLLLSCKLGLHPWIRINRVIRDIPNQSIIAGNSCTNLRQTIHDKMKTLNLYCRCLRCREIKDKHIQQRYENKLQTTSTSLILNEKEINNNKSKKKKVKKSRQKEKDNTIRERDRTIVLRIRKYDSYGGLEFFISLESKDETDLFGFIRLRMRYKDDVANKKASEYQEVENYTLNNYYSSEDFIEDSAEILEKISVIRNSALIRELHIYGTVVPHYTTKNDVEGAVQHKGFGKTLLRAAEYLSFLHGFSRIVVISGVGVREYYGNNGYSLEDTYMVKDLDSSSISISDDFEVGFLDCSLKTNLFSILEHIRKMESNRELRDLRDSREIPGLAINKEIGLDNYINSISPEIFNNDCTQVRNSCPLIYKEYELFSNNNNNNNIKPRILGKMRSIFYRFSNHRVSWIIGIGIITTSIFGLTYIKNKKSKFL